VCLDEVAYAVLNPANSLTSPLNLFDRAIVNAQASEDCMHVVYVSRQFACTNKPHGSTNHI
jgi:hypothetical protein